MINIGVTYVLNDNFSKGFQKFQAYTESTLGYIDRLVERSFKINQITQTFANLNQTINELSGPGAQFQQQMADLQAITGIAGKELDILGAAARKVGISSGLGASDAAEAFKLLASNIDIATIGGIEGLKQLQKETITLSKAAGIDLPLAADTMSFAINQFGLSAKDASRVINVLGAGAKYGAAEIPDLAESLRITGTTAAQAGINIESTVGALEILSQNALKGSLAGTGLRNVLIKLQTEEIPGVNLQTMGLSKSLAALKPYLNDTTFLAKTFGVENINVAQILIRNAEAVDQMTQKVTDTNVAYEQAEIRANTFNTTMAKMKAFFDDFKISIFNASKGVLPYLNFMADGIRMVSSLAPGILFLKDAYLWLASAENRELIVKKLSLVWDGIIKGSKYAAAAALYVFTTATWASAQATVGLTAAQTGLNAALAVSPIGWIIIAIGALVAAVIIAWKKFEGFREAITGLWYAVKQVFTNIGNFFKKIFEPIVKAIDAIKHGKWGEAAKQIGIGLYNLSPVGMAANAVKFAKEGGFTKDVGKAYQEGVNIRKAKDEAGQQAKTTESLAQIKAGENFLGSGAGEEIKPVTAPGISEVAVGGTRVFNININNLVNTLEVITNTIKESPAQIRDIVAQALMEAVNDSQMAAV